MYFSEDSLTITDTDAEYALSTSSEPHFPTKKELDDLIRVWVLRNLEQSY